MFHAMPAGSLIEARPEQIVGLMRSLNTPSISFGGGRKTPSRAHILGVRFEGGALGIYICLSPLEGRARYLFCGEPEQVEAAQYPQVEALALELVKRYGFTMERLEFGALAEEHRAALLQEVPLRWSDISALVGELASLLAAGLEEDGPLEAPPPAATRQRAATEERAAPAPPVSRAWGVPPGFQMPPSPASLDLDPASLSEGVARAALDVEEISALLRSQGDRPEVIAAVAELLAMF
jgi:hypothetical protein